MTWKLRSEQFLDWPERAARLTLALWFLLPASVSLAGTGWRYFSGVYDQSSTALIGIALSLAFLAAGVLAARGRYFLAVIFLIVEVGGDLLTLAGFLTEAAPGGGAERAMLAPALFAVVGVAWILSGRHGGRRLSGRALVIGLMLAFALNVPVLGAKLGRGLGVVLAPDIPSRIAEVGERLPDLRLVDLSGAAFSPVEEGTIYIVNYWATWCGPCRLELPMLLDMIEELPEGSPVRLIAVNTEGLGRDAVEEFIEKEGLEGLEVFTDPGGPGELLGTSTIPLTVVIRDRTLLSRHVGYAPGMIRGLKRELLDYLGGERSGVPSPRSWPVP